MKRLVAFLLLIAAGSTVNLPIALALLILGLFAAT